MVNLLRGILMFAVLQNFLTAVLIWQVATKWKERAGMAAGGVRPQVSNNTAL